MPERFDQCLSEKGIVYTKAQNDRTVIPIDETNIGQRYPNAQALKDAVFNCADLSGDAVFKGGEGDFLKFGPKA